ncbi:hypothetical protein EHQ82_10935 [Leptospira selangorensis]|uniref:Holliday junction resolvase n=1 Tax=Leptospira selangorensis TaxID=2484982 RepID=A0ABY2N9R5_9LEPT|nr:hypothetical protein [Leptospira selangorensis]TGM19061.1 hypothetical protein EHQ82_10935 [Leptospira selangorensis]
MIDDKFTHTELVAIAYKWLLNNTSCGVAFKELVATSNTNEIPDVIGFGSQGFSVLIECKTSRADFFADRKKHFRTQFPEMGMGSHRLYCAPKGMIKIGELPDGWGLIEVNEKGRAKCVHKKWEGNNYGFGSLSKNLRAEHSLMYSALRRLHIRNRIDEIYLGIPEKTKEVTI